MKPTGQGRAHPYDNAAASGAKKGKRNVRYSNGHARRQIRKWLAAQGNPCWICGKAIDYSLPAGHPMAFEVDEALPVSLGGSPIDRSNVRAAHRICNERRGNGVSSGKRKGLPLSREW